MRNYISQAVRQARPHFELKHDALIRDRIEHSQAFPHNSVRGAIEGEGVVRNCFIFGRVRLAKGAMLLNSIVDAGVNLEIEEDAIVTDCSLHAISNGDHDIPVDVKVKKHAKVCHVVASQTFEVGEYARLEVVSFNATDRMYGCTATNGVHIGDGSILYKSSIYLQANLDASRETGFTLGYGAILLHTSITVIDNEVTVGANSVWCAYGTGLSLGLDGHPFADMDTLLASIRAESLYDILNQDCKQEVTARFRDVSCTIGDDFYLATMFRIGRAFEKLPDPSVHIGDRVSIIDMDTDSTGTSTLICVHRMEIGNDVTLVSTTCNGYYGDISIRTITVGDNAMLLLRRTDDRIPAFDKFIPANKIATL